MPIIKIQKIPQAPKQIISLNSGDNLQSFITENGLEHCKVIFNGIEIHEDFDVNFNLKEHDCIEFYNQPEGGGIGKLLGAIFSPVTKLLSFLLPKPSQPNAAGQVKESPNNKLTGQTNIARTYQARPDVYGSPISYPDLINESLFQYVDNERFVTEWMNFGIGVYNIEQLRYSQSPLTVLAGSDYTIYQPNENIPLINEGFEFDDVDGQILPGPNESDENPAYEATSTNIISREFSGRDSRFRILRSATGDPFDYFHDLTKPHDVNFYIKVERYNIFYDSYYFEEVRVSATLVSSEKTDDGSIINPIKQSVFVFSNMSPAILNSIVIDNGFFRIVDNENLTVGPFFSPIAGNQFWVHLQADLGDGDYANARIQYYKVDDNNDEIAGTSGSLNAGFPAQGETKSFFKTVKIQPAAGYGRYALKLTRLENSNDTSKLRVEEIHSVTNRFNVRYKKDTVIRIETRATKQATGGRERKFNAMLTRHTISYNMTTRAVDYTLRPSRSFADAVLHTWLIIGGQPESSVDAYELYKIASELPDPRLGYFDYTFDDTDIALGARVETICNAATVTSYWEDGILSFVRDDKKLFPVMLFNASNVNIDAYKVNYDMTLPGGFDGVDLQYVNPVTNKYEQITLAIVGDQIVKQQPQKASKIELAGCRNKYQAMDRAILECRRLIYSRITQTITALRDGHSVSVGQVVRYSDTFDSNQQEGYIRSRNGNEFVTSEQIDFIGDMYVTVTNYLGVPTDKIRAYPLAGSKFGFVAAAPLIELNILDGEQTQSPSRYIIATQQEIDSTLWKVTQKKPNSDPENNGETANLTLVEYNEEMYDYQDLLDYFMTS